VIRVALADDQTLVRQGIKGLLELTPDIRVVAEASDGDEGLRIVTTIPVDVALLDVRMPHKIGLELLAELAGMSSRPPCILLTTFDHDAVAIEAIKLGAAVRQSARLHLDSRSAARTHPLTTALEVESNVEVAPHERRSGMNWDRAATRAGTSWDGARGGTREGVKRRDL
jgi:DNA-binding NarL/FixJ family response regulator